jgi:hypothetical protein
MKNYIKVLLLGILTLGSTYAFAQKCDAVYGLSDYQYGVSQPDIVGIIVTTTNPSSDCEYGFAHTEYASSEIAQLINTCTAKNGGGCYVYALNNTAQNAQPADEVDDSFDANDNFDEVVIDDTDASEVDEFPQSDGSYIVIQVDIYGRHHRHHYYNYTPRFYAGVRYVNHPINGKPVVVQHGKNESAHSSPQRQVQQAAPVYQQQVQQQRPQEPVYQQQQQRQQEPVYEPQRQVQQQRQAEPREEPRERPEPRKRCPANDPHC